MEENSEVNVVVKTESPIEIEPPAEIKNFQPNRRGGGRGGGNRFGGRGLPGNRGGGGDRDGNSFRNDNEFKGRRGGGGGRGGFRGGPGNRPDDQNDGGGGGGGGIGDGGPRGRMNIDRIQDKINSLQGPTYELPPLEISEKKFNGRNRLYVGNISSEVTEQELNEVFQTHGETAELFVNKEKNFGFIKMDYRINAEKAKRELDGYVLKGRNLKIRFAPNCSSIKVKNLSNYVTNELLYLAFSAFGEIERVQVLVDERGKPVGEGLVHFAKKFSAGNAIKKCKESCYFLTASLQPVIVEPYDLVDDIDGYSEKNINRKHPEFLQEREQPPRLALPGSFEFEYGQKWKALYDLYQQKEEALKKELKIDKEKLLAQMVYAKYEHETEMLRNQLRARELDKERQKREWEKMERMAEEERLRQDDVMRRSQQEIESRIMPNSDEIRRRQENNLFLQTHNLDSILEQQEQTYDQQNNFNSEGSPHIGVDMEPKQFMSSYERHNRFDGRDASNRGSNSHGGRGHWVSDNRRDDYQLKRRRF